MDATSALAMNLRRTFCTPFSVRKDLQAEPSGSANYTEGVKKSISVGFCILATVEYSADSGLTVAPPNRSCRQAQGRFRPMSNAAALRVSLVMPQKIGPITRH